MDLPFPRWFGRRGAPATSDLYITSIRRHGAYASEILDPAGTADVEAFLYCMNGKPACMRCTGAHRRVLSPVRTQNSSVKERKADGAAIEPERTLQAEEQAPGKSAYETSLK